MKITLQKLLARTVSVIFHPLNAPTYGLIFIFTAGTYVSLLPFEAKKLITLVIGINTLVLPLVMIPLFHRLGIIKSIHMPDHKERLVPIVFTLIPYAFSFYFLRKLPIPNIVPLYMLAATATVVLTLIVTIWWKISIHMVGIGGLAGLVFAFALIYQANVLVFLVLSFLFAGIVAWARLSLKAHNPAQVYSGFLLGWLTMVCVLLFI
jgi:membrane-associated phospholipid phosphatase